MTAVTIVCVAVVELVTMCTFTSSRVPVIPMGSAMPRLVVHREFLRDDVNDLALRRQATARAVSMTRFTSSPVISRARVAIGVTPWLLELLM